MTPPRWFKGCLTAWAVQFVQTNWHMVECRWLVGEAASGAADADERRIIS